MSSNWETCRTSSSPLMWCDIDVFDYNVTMISFWPLHSDCRHTSTKWKLLFIINRREWCLLSIGGTLESSNEGELLKQVMRPGHWYNIHLYQLSQYFMSCKCRAVEEHVRQVITVTPISLPCWLVDVHMFFSHPSYGTTPYTLQTSSSVIFRDTASS